MEQATFGFTYQQVSELTGLNRETVRRAFRTGRPSHKLVEALCRNLDLDAQWLLTGEGLQSRSETRRDLLQSASPRDHLEGLASRLKALDLAEARGRRRSSRRR